jgi:hypothetical protein
VITADIPLADRVVAKKAFAMNPRGKLYTEHNIKDLLAMRNLLNELRDNGMMTGGPAGIIGGGIGVLVGTGLKLMGTAAEQAEHLAAPAKEYALATTDIAIRAGRRNVETARYAGLDYGYGPTQTAQMMGQLYTTGAQAGTTSAQGLRPYGFTSDESTRLFTSITRAGGAGGRTQSDYEKIAKELKIGTKESKNIAEYTEMLVGLTDSSSQHLSDIDDKESQMLRAFVKWGEESESAMLRGGRGAQTFATLKGAIGGTQDPAQNAFLMQVFQKYNAGEGMLGEKGYMSWRHKSEAMAQYLEEITGTEHGAEIGAAGIEALTGGGINYEKALKITRQVEKTRGTPGSIAATTKAIEEADKGNVPGARPGAEEEMKQAKHQAEIDSERRSEEHTSELQSLS